VVASPPRSTRSGPLGKTVADCAHLHSDRRSRPAGFHFGRHPVPDYCAELAATCRATARASAGNTSSAACNRRREGRAAAVAELEARGRTLSGAGVAAGTAPTPSPLLSDRHRRGEFEPCHANDGVKYGIRAPADNLLDMYRRTREEARSEVKRRIMLGTYALSAATTTPTISKRSRCAPDRTAISFAVLEHCDAIATPSDAANRVPDRRKSGRPATDVPGRRFTVSLNLPGPARPVSALRFRRSEHADRLATHRPTPSTIARLLDVAYAYEQATDWHRATPPER